MVEVYRKLIVCGDCCARLMNSCRDADPDELSERAEGERAEERRAAGRRPGTEGSSQATRNGGQQPGDGAGDEI